ncbi:NAD(P)-dependent oxidoreductase, partial [Escherichia coli]
MRLLILGPGYAAKRLIARLVGHADVAAIDRARFEDRTRTMGEIAAATHILSTVPPGDDGDPVLAAYGAEIAA